MPQRKMQKLLNQLEECVTEATLATYDIDKVEEALIRSRVEVDVHIMRLHDALESSLRFAGHLPGCDWADRAMNAGKGCSCGYLVWRDKRADALKEN